MKIHLLTFAGIVLFAFGASAQITPKSYTIGGGFSTSFGKTGTSQSGFKQFNIALSPTIGKFTSEKWLLEGGIGYGYSNSRILQTGPITNAHSFSVTFGATRFIPITDRFYFTIGSYLSPSYSLVKSENIGITPFESTSSVSSANLSVSPGLTYFINNKWMIYSNFGALGFQVSGRSNSDVIDYNFGMNLSSTSYLFGLRYVLGNSK